MPRTGASISASRSIDVDRLRGFKNKVVDKLTSGTGQVAKLRKVTYLQGRASIVSPTRLHVALENGGEQTVEVDAHHPRDRFGADAYSSVVDRQPARARFHECAGSS